MNSFIHQKCDSTELNVEIYKYKYDITVILAMMTNSDYYKT